MANKTSLARGTVLGVLAQLWQLITAFLLYHFLAQKFGLAGFGRWKVALSVLNYCEALVTGGLVQVASKRLAENPADAPRIEASAYFGQMFFAGTLFLLLEATAGLIAAALREPALAALIRIAALDIPIVAAFMLASNLQLGRHYFARQVLGMFAYATAKFVAIGALVWLGFSVQGALIGNAISSIVGFAVLFTPLKATGVRIRTTIAEARGMGLAAVPFLTERLVGGISSDSGLWFVQAFRGSSVSGFYGGAAALSEVPLFLFAGLSRVLFPSVVRAGADKGEGLVARYATQGIRLALLVTVLGVALIAVTGREALLLVYTPAFAVAALPFTGLMVASVGRNVSATCSVVLMARGQRRQALTIVIAAAVAEVALLAAITPVYGPVGAAACAAVVALGAGLAGGWVLRELLGWRVVWTFARAAVAAAIVGAGLAVVQPARLWLIPAYVVAVIVYGLLLRLLREIDDTDIASARAAFGGAQ